MLRLIRIRRRLASGRSQTDFALQAIVECRASAAKAKGIAVLLRWPGPLPLIVLHVLPVSHLQLCLYNFALFRVAHPFAHHSIPSFS
jgi:hypothetical protein